MEENILKKPAHTELHSVLEFLSALGAGAMAQTLSIWEMSSSEM